MRQYTFLVEIGVEELPCKILKNLGYDFATNISHEFQNNGISCVETNWFVSSRHLAVKSKICINNINIAYFDKFNEHDVHNIPILNKIENKRNKISTNNIKKNDKIEVLLNEIVRTALLKLTNYEMMRWSDISTPFIRPVHTVTILLDTYLIKGCFFGIHTDRVLHGHQCMTNNIIVINHADDYPEILFKEGQVIVDHIRRKEIICVRVEEEAKKIGGLINIEDHDLFDEVTSSIEWPVILVGKFDRNFLNLPREIIRHIIKYNQKCFPIYSVIDGILLPYFIFVINVVTKNYMRIVIGYENIIKLHLMDAKFFLNEDNQYCLEDYISKLDSVLFHSKLGTLREKSFRIAALSEWIAEQIGVDPKQARRAGYLCKCDLMSNMVFEFPLYQGVIGMHYALRDGESEEVALAQKEHYHPKFSADILPTTYLSCVVAMADKMDTISGIFGTKELPRGNRDPFALRRSAFGILRILIQKKLSLNLSVLIEESVKLYEKKLVSKTVIKDIHLFMYKRLYSWYCMQNFRVDVIKSVLAVDCFNILSVDARIRAVNIFCSVKQEENIKLCLIYKRILNIIKKKQAFYEKEDLESDLLQLPEEIQLANQVILAEKKVNYFLKTSSYDNILVIFVSLFDSINKFFNYVTVMDTNEAVQKNRLILLNRIKILFTRVMDISFL